MARRALGVALVFLALLGSAPAVTSAARPTPASESDASAAADAVDVTSGLDSPAAGDPLGGDFAMPPGLEDFHRQLAPTGDLGALLAPLGSGMALPPGAARDDDLGPYAYGDIDLAPYAIEDNGFDLPPIPSAFWQPEITLTDDTEPDPEESSAIKPTSAAAFAIAAAAGLFLL